MRTILAALAAVLLATPVLAAPPPAAPLPPMHTVSLSDADLAFLAAFITHYAGQGCDIHTQGGVDACQAAPQALQVWQRLQASAVASVKK